MSAISKTAPLLVELGTEELPPRALRNLSEAFAENLRQGLVEARLAEPDVPAQAFASPRRLAVKLAAVARRQTDQEVTRRGPAVAAAFDADGEPTPAARGFAGSCGVAVEKLQRLKTDRGEWLVHAQKEKGRSARDLLPEILEQATRRLPIPKRMRWADLDAEFVRPVHWLVVLHGEQVVPAQLLSVKSGRRTRGHRFHCSGPIRLRSPADYPGLLKKPGYVIADFAVRRELVRTQVEKIAGKLGGKAVIDPDLLEEVSSLVEWPQAIGGDFDPEFLKLPDEALISAMQDHQRYFPVADARGRLLPHFITVANLRSRRPSLVREGNQRVLRARFTDAAFFWNTDRSRPLASRLDSLGGMVFHARLGSLLDKTQRVRELAGWIGAQLNGDRSQCERAAELAKTDLTTLMVGEFPELQGTMGKYYARHDREPADVAAAMAEQYLPRQAGDALPRRVPGQALALADRLDSLVGLFGAGEAPSGDKDPYALRRAALGVLRILIERKLDLDLTDLLQRARDGYGQGPGAGADVGAIFDFCLDRLRRYYQQRNVPADVIDAVRDCRPTRPLDFDQRVRGVDTFRRLPEAESLAAANKRIRNILRQAGDSPFQAPGDTEPEPAEAALATALVSAIGEARPRISARDYTAALKGMASLRNPVDRFFEEVMVMDEDPGKRAARLDLLKRLSDLFLEVADISRLQG
ncbi:MAG: glycine--tRNA ligase subunit beta [Gammaproteobacteria bacterium]|jgi:glycyl-tRNA synthetase beta chain|nr:glycine--tRNA ligase subunit beta [Gammaproteobacteria bacterium]